MPKTPQFIVDMKAQPRSMKHGNRKTATPSHGNPVDRTSSRDDRADASTTYNFASSINPPIRAFDPRVIAEHIRYMREIVDETFRLAALADLAPSTPHIGIRAGEIIGYRLWWVSTEGTLRSLTQTVCWVPGKPTTGDVEKCVNTYSWKRRFGGVYAFKSFDRAAEEFEVACQDLIKRGLHLFDFCSCGLALGSVKLWGEVVEHEHGYRASFAKPNSLDVIYYWARPKREPKEVYFGCMP